MNPPSAAYLTAPASRWYTDADMPMLIEKARELRKIGLRFSPEDVGGNDRLRRIYLAVDSPTTNRTIRRRIRALSGAKEQK